MDDRYLFKGKRPGNGEWVVGWYEECPLDRGSLTPCIIPSELARSGEFCYVEVDPSTVAPCNDKWISVKDRLPDNSEYDWVLASVQELSLIHISGKGCLYGSVNNADGEGVLYHAPNG